MAGVVDTRVLGRPPLFGGEDEAAWISWSFVFRAYMGAVSADIQDGMLAADGLPTEIKMSALNETRQTQAR